MLDLARFTIDAFFTTILGMILICNFRLLAAVQKVLKVGLTVSLPGLTITIGAE